jgi:ankyrin repeat protein
MKRIAIGLLFTMVLAAQGSARVEFGRDIQPIFKQHCVECHGPSQQMRGLRLDRRRDALPNRVGANGVRIVPGDAAKSTLYRRINATEDRTRMPPSGPLKPDEIKLIGAWIDQGAEWPDAFSGEVDVVPPDPAVVRMRDALRLGERRTFERLLADYPSAVNGKGPRGWTVLMYAALYGDAAALRLVLDRGAKVDAQNESGGTALLYAIDNPDKVDLLLKRGANLQLASGEGGTPLNLALGRVGSTPVVRLLLDSGLSVKGMSLREGAHDAELMELLIERGANPKPLPFQVVRGCERCFDALMKMATPDELRGALTTALRAGNPALVKSLVDKGAQADANALRFAALIPAPIPAETFRTVLGHGPDIHAKTSNGWSYAELAIRNGNATLAGVLRDAGVKDAVAAAEPVQAAPAASTKAAVERSLPLLQRSDVTFLQKAGCVSCHNNSLTAITVASARARRVGVNEETAKEQLRKIAAFLQENAERALEGLGLPGANDTVSYILLGMAAEKYPSDPITDVWARYVKDAQSADGVWNCAALRPPIESSDFEVTAASIRVMRVYAPPAQRAEYEKAAQRGVEWLAKSQPVSTEDHAFRILGMIWGGAKPETVRKAAKELAMLQRADGGWGQVPGLASDAYATGQALVALRESGELAAVSTGYRRGAKYLVESQAADGSWYVRTRAVAIQPYFDADFPYKNDQFVSTAATNWATQALLAGMSEARSPQRKSGSDH